MARYALGIALLQAGEGSAPDRIRLFRAGQNPNMKGRPLVFDADAAAAVMAAWRKHGARLMFDYCHASLAANPPDPKEAGKAAGWFDPAIGPDGELEAVSIEWTAAAAAAIEAREYLYFSPAVVYEKESGRVVRLINVALSNLPALEGLDALIPLSAYEVGSEEDRMLEELRKKLGLPEGATEEEIMAAVDKLRSAEKPAEKPAEPAAAQMSQATEKPAEPAVSPEARRLAVEAVVDRGIRARRIPVAKRDEWIGAGVKSGELAAFSATVDGLPELGSADDAGAKDADMRPATGTAKHAVMTPEDHAAAAALGLTPEDYRKAAEAGHLPE